MSTATQNAEQASAAADVVTDSTSRCASKAHSTPKSRRPATVVTKKEAVAEEPVSRQVMKSSMSGGAGPWLNTDHLASLLKDIPSSGATSAKGVSSNGKATEEFHGDSAVKGSLRGAAVSASVGPTKVVTTEHRRVVTDEIGFDAPKEDTTTTSFEAHVRMRMSRPRVPESKAATPREGEKTQRQGTVSTRGRQNSSRRTAAAAAAEGPVNSLCPDCNGGGTVVHRETVARGCSRAACLCCCCCCRSSGDEECCPVEPPCCSRSSCSSSCSEDYRTDASSGREQWFSAGSVSSTSACSGCQEPEIGTLLHTSVSVSGPTCPAGAGLRRLRLGPASL